MSSTEESKAPEEKKPAARRSSLKTSDTGSKLDPQNLLKIKGKRHSVSFGQSNTFQFKAMKAMFQESHDADKPKKANEEEHKKFVESRKKSIKNEFSLVKELMKQNKIQDGMMFKIENDPRIIGGENGKGIGNFIRKHSIDEFPQFINVLKGDMSLVGTRPPTEDEWIKYDLHHRKRMAIKPGITGMWQTSGRSDIIDFEEVVKLDAKYITNWSIGLDIKLILKTFFMIFKSDEGSY